MTSNSTNLSSTFDKNDDLNEATNIFPTKIGGKHKSLF